MWIIRCLGPPSGQRGDCVKASEFVSTMKYLVKRLTTKLVTAQRSSYHRGFFF